jgi:hypothetical protein
VFVILEEIIIFVYKMVFMLSGNVEIIAAVMHKYLC